MVPLCWQMPTSYGLKLYRIIPGFTNVIAGPCCKDPDVTCEEGYEAHVSGEWRLAPIRRKPLLLQGPKLHEMK